MSQLDMNIELNAATRIVRITVRNRLAVQPQVFELPFAFVKVMASKILEFEANGELQPKPVIARPN